MSQVFFLAILLLVLIIFALTRLAGFRIRFEPLFRVLASAFVMLPVMLMSALVVLTIEVGVCVVVLLVLHLAGFLQNFSDIPDQYARLGLWVLIAIAIAFAGFNWVRDAVLDRDE
jgi:hypothetical protein